MPTTITIADDDPLLDLPARQFKRAILERLRLNPSRARIGAPDARASLSVSEIKKEEVREREEELPRAWREAAQRERERAGMEEVNLQVEWVKMLNRPGWEPRLGSWLRWALMAYRTKANAPVQPAAKPSPKPAQPAPLVAAGDAVLEDIKCRAHLREFFESGGQHWPRVRGPKPGEPECQYPTGLIEKYRRRYQQGGDDAEKQTPPPRENQGEGHWEVRIPIHREGDDTGQSRRQGRADVGAGPWTEEQWRAATDSINAEIETWNAMEAMCCDALGVEVPAAIYYG